MNNKIPKKLKWVYCMEDCSWTLIWMANLRFESWMDSDTRDMKLVEEMFEPTFFHPIFPLTLEIIYNRYGFLETCLFIFLLHDYYIRWSVENFDLDSRKPKVTRRLGLIIVNSLIWKCHV